MDGAMYRSWHRSLWRNATTRLDVRCSIVWVAVYCLVWATGERVNADEAVLSWQLAPIDALEQAPAQTLWHIHTQPPLWNAVIAGILRVSPVSFTVSIQLLMMLCGVVLCLAVFRIASALGASGRAAFVITIVATLNSQVLSSAFSVRYELPVTALVALLVALLTTKPSSWSIAAITSTGAVITMTRALYHPLWLVVVVAIVMIMARGRVSRSALALAAVIPLVIVGGWMVKNATQRGDFGLSSWTGMNLLRSVDPAVADNDIASLHERGIVSDVALVGYFAPYERYAPFMPPCEAQSGVKVLSEPLKGTTPIQNPFGSWIPENFNYECYLPVFDKAGADAVAIIRHHPGDWLEARTWAANNWFTLMPIEPPSPVMRAIDNITHVVLVAVPHPGALGSWAGHGIWVHTWPESLGLAALTAIALCAGVRRTWRLVRWRSDEGSATLVAVTAFTVAWTMLTGIGLELGEQDRFRAVIDPIVIAVGGTIALQWWRDRQRRPDENAYPPATGDCSPASSSRRDRSVLGQRAPRPSPDERHALQTQTPSGVSHFIEPHSTHRSSP